MASVLLQKTPYGSFGGQPGGTLSRTKKDLNPSVMDKGEELPLTAEELARQYAERDAIGPPTVGPVSIDPTDWLTPGGLVKTAAILKGIIAPAVATSTAMLVGSRAAGPSSLLSRTVGKGQAGIIAGGRASANDLGIMPIVNHIEELAKSGVSQHKIAQVSSELLAEKRNPGGAMSMFIGPDGKSRVVLANKDSQLHNPVIETRTVTKRGALRIKLDPLFDDLGDHTRINLKKDEPLLLSDTLLHPSLYNVSNKASTAEVSYNEWIDILNQGGLGASKDAKTVYTGSVMAAPSKKSADQLGHVQEGLLHEANHIVQLEQGLRTGTSNDISALRAAIQEAKDLGSFKTDARLQAYETILDRMDLPAYRNKDGSLTDRGRNILDTMYKTNYGEWEARAGSEYSDTTFPMMYEKGKTW